MRPARPRFPLLEPLDPRRLFSAAPDFLPTSVTLFNSTNAFIPGDHLFPNVAVSCSDGPSQVVPVAFTLSIDTTFGNADDIPLSSHALEWAYNPSDSVHAQPPLALALAAADLPATLAPGAYHLFATVDPDDAVAESDETNNTILGPTITVTPAATDFALTNLTLNTTTLQPDATFTLNLTTSRIGPVGERHDVYVSIALSTDDIIGNADDVPLTAQGYPGGADPNDLPADSGRTTPVSAHIPSTLPNGTYHLVATLHVSPPDANPANDTLVGPIITVSSSTPVDNPPASSPPPILPTPLVHTLHPGNAVSTPVVLSNPSRHTKTARLTITQYLSSDPALSRDDLKFSVRHITFPLRPGQSKSVTLSAKLPATAPLGTRYLITLTTAPTGRRTLTAVPVTLTARHRQSRQPNETTPG